MKTVKISEAVNYELDVLKVMTSKKYKTHFTKGKLIAIALKNLHKIMSEKDVQ